MSRRGERPIKIKYCSRWLTWGGDAGDDGEDVHEVDEAPRLGEPSERPGQRGHAGAALADRHVHVVVGTGGRGGGRGDGDAPRRPIVRLLQLLYLPRAAGAITTAVGVARRQVSGAITTVVCVARWQAAGVLYAAAAATGLCHTRASEVLEECEDEQESSSGASSLVTRSVCPPLLMKGRGRRGKIYIYIW